MSENGNKFLTLPAEWYHSPKTFEREQAQIFARQWTLIARADQLPGPGDYVSGKIAGRPIFVIRDRDGGLRGFHNVCRHRAGPLVTQDQGRCSVLRCAYHGWLYDLQGQLKKTPDFGPAEDFDLADFNLFPLRVAQWNELIFATLQMEGQSLEDWLGDIVSIAADFVPLSEMEFHCEDLLEGETNWKTYADNSAEGYHVTTVHRSLGQAVAREEVSISPYENGKFVGFDVTYRSDDYSGGRRGFWIYKHACLLLHFAATSFNLERVIPLSENRIRLIRWFWFSKDCGLSTEEKDALVQNSSQVMREDLAICEAVQRNLTSGLYESGRLSPTMENGTIYIQSLVREALA